jgi:hypothetical protein
MANVKIDIAAEFTGNKAFKQAETASQKMERSVAKLGKQLLGVFAATKLISFGKTAAKAFAADEKAARSLSLALANTGNAFAAIEVEKFIADLQRTTGVLDDNLRPAFRTLLTATGDVKKSQDGLALALDIAAGTGKDLGAVSMALSKAYGGQTTALSRLGAGLSKATLASGDMDVITQALTDKFSGQALAAAEGYAGSMDRLAVASANAKEIIGKDLLDAMQLIAGKDGIGGATTAMEGFATEVGNAIYGVGVLISKLKSIPGGGFISDVLTAPTGLLALLSNFGKNRKATAAGTPAQSPGQRKAIDKANAEALKLQKSKNSLAVIDNANTTRKLVLTADQQALEELKKKFDIERIQINAALNENIDQETRLRLQSLLAIHDNDAALAGKIKKELEAADAAGVFAGAARAAAELLRTSYSAGLSSFKQSEFDSLAASANTGITAPSTSTSSMPSPLDYGTFGAGTFRAAEAATTNIQVNVGGSITTERDLVSAITEGIYNNQAAGIPISYTTAFR